MPSATECNNTTAMLAARSGHSSALSLMPTPNDVHVACYLVGIMFTTYYHHYLLFGTKDKLAAAVISFADMWS